MEIQDTDAENASILLFWCPGCKEHHGVNIVKPNRLGAVWTWDGDVDKPTFNPSVVVGKKNENGSMDVLCHLFVRSGHIQYLSDCKHELSGKTVVMEDLT